MLVVVSETAALSDNHLIARAKLSNIFCFQFPKCDDLLLIFVLYDC